LSGLRTLFPKSIQQASLRLTPSFAPKASSFSQTAFPMNKPGLAEEFARLEEKNNV